MLMPREGGRDEAQKLHRKWMKHQAFMTELAHNRECLNKTEHEGEELIQEQPELRAVVQQKLHEMRECWTQLESTTKAKARQLFDMQNHRTGEPGPSNLSLLDQHLSVLQDEPLTGTTPSAHASHATPTSHAMTTSHAMPTSHAMTTTLLPPCTTFSQQLQRIQSMEAQMQHYQGVAELRGGASVSGLSNLGGAHLMQRGPIGVEDEDKGGVAETRICRLIEPLKERRRILLASKEMHQVAQELEDEIVWIQESLPVASSKEYGINLQSVQQLVKGHEALQMEMQARRSRLEEVLERAENVAALRTPEVEFVREGAQHVRQLWEVLQVEVQRRTVMLDAVSSAQQYYTEASKAESWLSGQKLHVLNQENGNDESSTLRLLKDQLALEQKVESFAETVTFLSQQCRRMLEQGHPDSEQLTKQQGHIDRLYVSLKDLLEQKKAKLEQQYWLYQLKQEVDALEKWISERETVASSTELGRNLEHVTVLQETFTEFRAETSSVGQRQMDSVNKMVNEMIECGHADAAVIAEWKDSLNESWADLLEIMETRGQMLAASHQLHGFFTDCQEVLVQIEGKMRQLPEMRSCQVSTANPGTLQRLLHNYEHSLQLLVSQVRQLQENAAQLCAIYAGDKADAILAREQEVMRAWKELLVACEGSRVQVTTVTDKIQFFAMVRELSMWTDGIMGQMGTSKDARDLSALNSLMSQHQNLKSKIENKAGSFSQCVEMGKLLLAAHNPAAEEVKEKLDYLMAKQKDLNDKWEQNWEKLQCMQQRLESSVPNTAEPAWLSSKDPIRSVHEAEGGTDEVEQLIRRHEAFRKAASKWKEHFSSLRQAEKMKEEQNKAPASSSLLNRQMFPLSCLVPSSSSSSSSSSLFRNPLQDTLLESKPVSDLSRTVVHPATHPLTQRISSVVNRYSPVTNGSPYHGLNQQVSVLGTNSSSYAGINQQGVLGVDSSSYTGLNQQIVVGADSSSSHGMNHLGAVGVSDLKPYGWQHQKADFLQSNMNHVHRVVPALGGAVELPGSPVCMDPSLEMIHSRLQRDPRGSRSDPQMDHLRREREYRLGRQTSSEQEIQARLNELPLIVRQERYRRRLERQSSSEHEGSGKQRLQRQDSSDLEEGSDRRQTGEKGITMADVVDQVQEREASLARGESYRPPSSLSAPVSRLDRPRARDRPKPRRRPRPKEPEETRRSRSAPAQSALGPPQQPTHTVHHEGFLYCKHREETGTENSPNRSWMNLFCVLNKGEIVFYKDMKNKATPYEDEPPLNLAVCTVDTTNGYKKKKNVFILKTETDGDYIFLAKDEEEHKTWVNSINTSLAEIEEIAKWEKPTTSSTDPDKSERKECSEGAEPSEGAERSEKSEKSEQSERSDKVLSDKSSEKRDTLERERVERQEQDRGGDRRERDRRERDRDRGERDRDRGERDRGERGERDRDRGERDKERDKGERARGDRGERDKRERDRGDRDRGERDRGERDRGDRDKGERDRGDRDRDRGDRDKGERDRGDRDRDRGEKGDRSSRGSSTSGKSK
ncbi:spectrin beta chain, non-erythrocytic 4 [Brachyhypopomus gauderio]|uniref:spectrin beta chain, non-erythrocytic 4 n=1 Tax=Brachyhypopomus gauderio TaxID=698409 RepID=UPI0040421BDE